MKESNTLANIAATKQLKRAVLKNTEGQYMKELDTLAKFVAIKQLGSQFWADTKNLCMN